MDVYYTFLDYTPCRDDGHRVPGNIVELDRLGAYIATLVTCLKEREIRRGHRRDIYTNTYASYPTAAIRQLAGPVGLFLKIGPGKLYFCTSLVR